MSPFAADAESESAMTDTTEIKSTSGCGGGYIAQLSELSIQRFTLRNILLINDANSEKVLSENIKLHLDQQDNVNFTELISYLRLEDLIVPGSSIFFFDVERQVFVHQGREPITPNTVVPLKKFSSEEIRIKFRPAEQTYPRQPQPPSWTTSQSTASSISATLPPWTQQSSQQSPITPRNCFMNNSMRLQGDLVHGCRGDSQFYTMTSSIHPQFWSEAPCSSQTRHEMMNSDGEDEIIPTAGGMCSGDSSMSKAIPREKRVKERKIGYVHDRVTEWRRYYEVGVANEQGRVQKVNLDVAAGLVGLSRKTLDDYYKYIRKAEMFKFDFKGRSEEKIGVLRNFVRDRQRRMSKQFDEEEEELEEDHQRNSKAEADPTTVTPEEKEQITNVDSTSCSGSGTKQVKTEPIVDDDLQVKVESMDNEQCHHHNKANYLEESKSEIQSATTTTSHTKVLSPPPPYFNEQTLWNTAIIPTTSASQQNSKQNTNTTNSGVISSQMDIEEEEQNCQYFHSVLSDTKETTLLPGLDLFKQNSLAAQEQYAAVARMLEGQYLSLPAEFWKQESKQDLNSIVTTLPQQISFASQASLKQEEDYDDYFNNEVPQLHQEEED